MFFYGITANQDVISLKIPTKCCNIWGWLHIIITLFARWITILYSICNLHLYLFTANEQVLVTWRQSHQWIHLFSLFIIHYSLKICTFADCMNNSHKETISIRIISCAFMVLAIAIFKPFGLEVWQWQTCVHLRQTEDNPPVGGCDLDSQITLEGTTNEHVTRSGGTNLL